MTMNNNISFDTDNSKYKSRSVLGSPQVPGITKFLLNKKLVKNEKQANMFMIVIAILSILLSTYVFAVHVFEIRLFEKKLELTPEQVQKIDQAKARRERVRQQQGINTNNNTNNNEKNQTQ